MPRAPRTVLEACIAKRGVHRGAVAAAFVAQWVMTTADLGRVPTTSEYADWWAISERNAWRHRAAIRDVFGERWPEAIEHLAGLVRERDAHGPRDVMALPAVG